jgi:hypothetical protein
VVGPHERSLLVDAEISHAQWFETWELLIRPDSHEVRFRATLASMELDSLQRDKIVVDLIEAVFLGFIGVAVPLLMAGLVILIVYAIYREVRGER